MFAINGGMRLDETLVWAKCDGQGAACWDPNIKLHLKWGCCGKNAKPFLVITEALLKMGIDTWCGKCGPKGSKTRPIPKDDVRPYVPAWFDTKGRYNLPPTIVRPAPPFAPGRIRDPEDPQLPMDAIWFRIDAERACRWRKVGARRNSIMQLHGQHNHERVVVGLMKPEDRQLATARPLGYRYSPMHARHANTVGVRIVCEGMRLYPDILAADLGSQVGYADESGNRVPGRLFFTRIDQVYQGFDRYGQDVPLYMGMHGPGNSSGAASSTDPPVRIVYPDGSI